MKSKLETYSLIVCFISLFGLVISIFVAIKSAIEITHPEFAMRSDRYVGYQLNETYWLNLHECDQYDDHGKIIELAKPSESAITEKRLAAFTRAIETTKREGQNSLVNSAIFIFLFSIVLFIHWRIAKWARKT